jgi:molecular chaperone GrpE
MTNQDDKKIEDDIDEVTVDVTEPENTEPSLEDQLSEMKDRWMRAVAETENLRKRFSKEKEDTLKYASTNFGKDIITITDYLDRALTSMNESDVQDEKLKAFIQGVEMTSKEVNNIFERHGIKKISPEGQFFDPNLHQAMMEIDSADHQDGYVVHVMQHGYILHDRLLRPAMVSVCKKNKA